MKCATVRVEKKPSREGYMSKINNDEFKKLNSLLHFSCFFYRIF